VMLAGNIDDTDEDKFCKDHPLTVASTPHNLMAGLDFHLRAPPRGIR
jgi:hypothetical protein